ncbi:hypothetical protein OQH61_07775 [Helicobacter sp. MIT 21-1697]|uniref:hypothetical protein n=1 Tax=Helicobacter sp. MIT 21-1697 TaxID=2993733 RepID=UPI00224B4DAA|nr:hypothetical protein [Helicobacter sp. MIT 21-1697]MCX2717630.1 hypothetical protein [Helicobacter sp. MIT 21-1697]
MGKNKSVFLSTTRNPMTKARLKFKLENHDYLNLGSSVLFDMLTFKIDFDKEEFLRIINGMRENVGLAPIDYVLPDKNTRDKESIMQEIENLNFITSKPSFGGVHQYLVKGRNAKQELYEEFYKYIFYNYELLDFTYSNYYKKIVWNGRQYWIMNSDIRYSSIINRNI